MTGRWIEDDGVVWFELDDNGGSLEPWEALPGSAQGQAEQMHFDEAYEDLVATIRSSDAVPGMLRVIEAQKLVISELEMQLDDTNTVPASAIWFGAVLSALVANEKMAEVWAGDIPDRVKAVWPGIFPEFRYSGETDEEHEFRKAAEETDE